MNHQAGDTGKALCHRDGRVSITWKNKTICFRNHKKVTLEVLAGCCDICGDAILIPAQETDKIAAETRQLD